MLGINGDEEEHPARRSARSESVKSTAGVYFQEDAQRRMMAIAIRIIRTW